MLRSAVAFRARLSAAQKIGLLLAAISYILAGVLHFIQTDAYLRIMPPYIPAHLFMVRASGVCEILGGLGLLIPQARRAAAWGLVALLVAVFPANIYMATNPMNMSAASIAPALLWGRLAVQPFLIWWVLWCTNLRVTFGDKRYWPQMNAD